MKLESLKISPLQGCSAESKNISGHFKSRHVQSKLFDGRYYISLNPHVFIPVVLIDKRVGTHSVFRVTSNQSWKSFELEEASPVNRFV
jgi:hypothetical protein